MGYTLYTGCRDKVVERSVRKSQSPLAFPFQIVMRMLRNRSRGESNVSMLHGWSMGNQTARKVAACCVVKPTQTPKIAKSYPKRTNAGEWQGIPKVSWWSMATSSSTPDPNDGALKCAETAVRAGLKYHHLRVPSVELLSLVSELSMWKWIPISKSSTSEHR